MAERRRSTGRRFWRLRCNGFVRGHAFVKAFQHEHEQSMCPHGTYWAAQLRDTWTIVADNHNPVS